MSGRRGIFIDGTDPNVLTTGLENHHTAGRVHNAAALAFIKLACVVVLRAHVVLVAADLPRMGRLGSSTATAGGSARSSRSTSSTWDRTRRSRAACTRSASACAATAT